MPSDCLRQRCDCRQGGRISYGVWRDRAARMVLRIPVGLKPTRIRPPMTKVGMERRGLMRRKARLAALLLETLSAV